MEQRFFICTHCGNIIAMVRDKGVPVVCCGEKMKEMLSVNEKLPVNEGTLFEERDLSTLATKQFVQEQSQRYTERLVAPALKALRDAKLTIVYIGRLVHS